jgi:hypothetical protein
MAYGSYSIADPGRQGDAVVPLCQLGLYESNGTPLPPCNRYDSPVPTDFFYVL